MVSRPIGGGNILIAMSVLCLSLLSLDVPGALANHRHYCGHFGYRHETLSVAGMQTAPYRILFKYEAILHYLRRLPENGLLLVLSEDCALYGMHPAETFAQDRNHVLTNIVVDSPCAQNAMQIWRHNASVRSLLSDLVIKAKVTENVQEESALLADIERLAPYEPVAGVYCALSCNIRTPPIWLDRPDVWALVLCDIPLYGGTHPHFRNAFFDRLNESQRTDGALLDLSDRAPWPQEPYSVVNPGRSIGLVTYYTANIASVGTIAEDNFSRYCRRNGYTLHVYRDEPVDAPPATTGAWLKPYFLKRHLPDHDWVFWLDADILFIDHNKPLEPLLAGRELALAHDIGPWTINTGVIGIKRTDYNRTLIDHFVELIAAAPDKTSTYANGGDQSLIAQRLVELGWVNEMGLDIFSLNTPWFYHQADSLMAHYYGMTNEARLILMTAQDRICRQRFPAPVQ